MGSTKEEGNEKVRSLCGEVCLMVKRERARPVIRPQDQWEEVGGRNLGM